MRRVDPRVFGLVGVVLLWQAYEWGGTVVADVSRTPILSFQPSTTVASSPSPQELPLLRLVAAAQLPEAQGASAGLDAAFVPPPAETPAPRITPQPAPPAMATPAPPPIDYASLLAERVNVQASSGRGAVINGRFIAWGESLPVPVTTPDRTGWEHPRLVARRGDHLQVSIAGKTLSIPMTRSAR